MIAVNVAILPNATKIDAINFIGNIINVIKEYNCKILLNHIYKTIENNLSHICFLDNDEELIKNCDIAIIIGGDGTIIHYGKMAVKYDKPLIGINFGRVGFVADIEPTEIDKIKMIFEGNYSIDKRILLEVTLKNNESQRSFEALNDAVITRGAVSRIIDLNVYLNNKFFSKYRADGLIFATPTGSTAYALSAGGPVIEPTIDAIILQPICPHSLLSRSIILKSDNIFMIKPDDSESNETYLTIDGQNTYLINKDDVVIIKKSKYELKLIKIIPKDFYQIINDKLCERII